jgi:hypothetical protein
MLHRDAECVRIYKGLYIQDIITGKEATSPWKSFIRAMLKKIGFSDKEIQNNIEVIKSKALK